MSYRNVKDRARGPNPKAASRYLDSLSGGREALPVKRRNSRFKELCRPVPAGGGEYRARTGDLLVANQALSQLS